MPRCLARAALAALAGLGFLAPLAPAWAKTQAAKPGTVFRDCATCPQMVVIPAGSFVMGSPESEAGREPHEGPQRKVTIARRFAVSRFEITRGEYREFLKATRHDPGKACAVWRDQPRDPGQTSDEYHRVGVQGFDYGNPNYPQTDRHPVVCVNWNDTVAYVAWLARKTGREYRLLSEAEWEYAARAGTTTPYSFGSNPEDACRFGNVSDLTAKEQAPRWHAFVNCRDGQGKGTAPVGSFRPNRFGLYDMTGNIFERVEDCYKDSYAGSPTDGSAWTVAGCERHASRGGGWLNDPAVFRSADRAQPHDEYRTSGSGIRVARNLP